MNKTTERALRGSIKKWERIVLGTGEDLGSYNCPLCAMFVEKNSTCGGCPVEQAGHDNCARSPYENFGAAYRIELRKFVGRYKERDFYYSYGEEDPRKVIGPLTMQAAIDEYNFLVSLLPRRK